MIDCYDSVVRTTYQPVDITIIRRTGTGCPRRIAVEGLAPPRSGRTPSRTEDGALSHALVIAHHKCPRLLFLGKEHSFGCPARYDFSPGNQVYCMWWRHSEFPRSLLGSLAQPSVPRRFPSGLPMAHCVFCLGGRLLVDYLIKRRTLLNYEDRNLSCVECG